MLRGVRIVVGTLVSGLLLCGAVRGQEPPWGEEKPAPQLPKIFLNAGPGARLAAEEVARQDAYRKLVERIYGTALDASTDVYDLALRSRVIDTALRNELKGMKEVGTRYYDDGRVEIAVKVTLREVVEIIKETYKRVTRDEQLVSEESLKDVERENRDKEILVVGRGGLAGSKGLEKVRAMRAAEADCYARLAARVFGLQITATTTVRDFVLSSDSIKSKVSVALLNGVKFTNYTFYDDGTCEVTGELTIREVVEVLKRTHKRYDKDGKVTVEQIENMEKQVRDAVITEVGKGTVREGEAMPAATETFHEKKTVIERVLEKGIVVTP